MFGEVNLQADESRDEWYLRCQLLTRPNDVRTADFDRIRVLLERYLASGNGAMVYLCQSLLEVDRRRAAHAEADRCLLKGIVNGDVDPLQEGVFERLRPMFAIYADDASMMCFVDLAASTFGAAAGAAATELLTRLEPEY